MTCPCLLDIDTDHVDAMSIFASRFDSPPAVANQANQCHNSKTSPIQRRAPVVTVPQFEDEPWLFTNNAVARLPHHSPSSNLFSQSCRILPHASYSSSIPCPPRAVRASSKLRFHPDTSLPRHCPFPWPFPVLQATCSWITYKEKGRSATRPFMSRLGRVTGDWFVTFATNETARQRM